MSKSKIGTKVGRWTIMSESKKQGTKYYVTCLCECGTTREVMTSSLSPNNPRSKSCGCLNREIVSGVRKQIDIGTRFGRYTVVGECFRENDESLVPVVCDCGVTKNVRRYSLESGAVLSCGCYNLERLSIDKRNLKHGMSQSETYQSWSSMKRRCNLETDGGYENYGGRGIKVCDRWMEPAPQGFLNFVEDMGEKPEGLTLERVDVNGNYSKENCIWADRTQQCFNRRKFKNKTSEFVGVHWDAWKEKWVATLKKNGEVKLCSVFKSEESAARAYDEACLEHYGVRKNFPDEN